MVAHFAMMINERGAAVLSSHAANSRGMGAIYGTASCATFTALGLLSTPSVRRASWEMFKAAHITFMPTAIILSIVHAYFMMPFILPPLLLWVLDVLLRSARSARSYSITAVTPLHGAAVRLEVATHGRLHFAPGQYAYVQLPAISPGEWHPLSVVAAPGDPTSVSFVITRAGPASFGARVASLSRVNFPSLRIRLDGCYGGPGLQLHRYSYVLLVAGGVGITPFASIAEYLLQCAAVEGSPLRAASLLWAVRTREAEDKWIPGLIPSLQASGLFTTTLCVTRSAASMQPEDETDGVTYGRPDVEAAVRTAVEVARANGAPARRVAVLACGPTGLVDDAQAAAAQFGVHFHAEKFVL
jgi:ferredoxin-NADP reductase